MDDDGGGRLGEVEARRERQARCARGREARDEGVAGAGRLLLRGGLGPRPVLLAVLAEQHGGSWSTEQGLALVGADMQDTALAMQAVGVEMDSAELVATLAEPFQRGTVRLYGDHAGVGLGLAIVKSITRAHDGSLGLTPRAAGGLCVAVRLPVDPAHRSA